MSKENELSLGNAGGQVREFVNQIRDHNAQIGNLLGDIENHRQAIRDHNAQIGNLLGEIEQHRHAIDRSMKQIESMLPAPAEPAVVCDTCSKTITANEDGFGYTVHYRDPYPNPGTIECYECCQLSPASRKFLIEDDAWTEEEEDNCRQEEEGYSSDDDYGLDPDYDHGFNCQCGSFDCRQFMQTTTGRTYKVYEHSEECG
jgi:hypothetical protein